MNTNLKNGILFVAFMILVSIAFTGCGVKVKVEGETKHTVGIDLDTLEALEEFCVDENAEVDQSCFQDLIDLVKDYNVNAEEAAEKL